MGRKVLLAAGGTGGHIWPAISFGRWIEGHKEGVSVEYACGKRPLELEIYKAAGILPHALSMYGSPFSGGGLERLRRARALSTAFFEARNLLKRFKPDVCVLFGGYLSFPFLAACRLAGVTAVMHEQNAYAGKVTRLAARLGVDVFSGWRSCEPLASSRFTYVGVPVREFAQMTQAEAWKRLELPGAMPAGPKVVVFTGSLGSTPVRNMIGELSREEQFRGWTFVLPAVADMTRQEGDNVWLLPKIWDAAPLFRLADMAVVRAGGSTLTEIGTVGVPSIVVPWRGAADDHQYHNAVAFIAENKAVMWNGGADKDEFSRKLAKLSSMTGGNSQKTSFRLYNNAGRISEDLWLAVSSRF